MATPHQRQEDRVASELLMAEAAGEAYMVELRRSFPERRLYTEFAARRTEVIDLSSDEDGDVNRDNPDPMISDMSRAEWKALEEESD